ncbi:hypothetical protein DKX38_028721 [Salix brachista]|uniref:Uncharacterized protein n=1 Tax=Salix brachista TaxID=2182728 RepID=A0A5N5JB30_9ROSI|nr:hypothetical protein DKX38_028721 [Salix brachista]
MISRTNHFVLLRILSLLLLITTCDAGCLWKPTRLHITNNLGPGLRLFMEEDLPSYRDPIPVEKTACLIVIAENSHPTSGEPHCSSAACHGQEKPIGLISTMLPGILVVVNNQQQLQFQPCKDPWLTVSSLVHLSP